VSRRLVLCSRNEHKAAELRAILAGWTVDVLDRDDYPAENGETFEENARVKARFGRLHAGAGTWVLGEDSGIEVDALGGRPGIHSARWADDPNAQLLRELAGVADRAARYRCAMVAIGPDGREVAIEGRLEGRVGAGPRGSGGFGYDPIFLPDGEERTVAELGDGWKAEHSHRAKAARALLGAIGATEP
jgi:XTP/dITP diphosphohydrolase